MTLYQLYHMNQVGCYNHHCYNRCIIMQLVCGWYETKQIEIKIQRSITDKRKNYLIIGKFV